MILKHRDRELLRFEWTGARGVRVLSVNEAERKFLPIDMFNEVTDESLWKWLSTRTVPRGRKNILSALRQLGIPSDDIRAIVEFSRGLSLNDVYWIVADGFSGSWSDYNLYDNDFSADIAVLALTGLGVAPKERQTSSPEFSTNGMLRKCWRRVNGKVLLYKGGTEGAINAGFEMYSEYYAAQIAARLGFDHVDYGLSRYKKVLCSTCSLFTSDKYGYLPAGRIITKDAALRDPKTSIENDEKWLKEQENANKELDPVGIKSTDFDSLGYQVLENMRADKHITVAEIADILQVERRTIERRIKQLRENGEIVRVGSRKTGYWLVNDRAGGAV